MDSDEEDLKIIARVKEALSESSAWDKKGFLRIEAEKWLPLEAASEESPEESGLYALGLSQGLSYDKAVSRIVYLGSAKNLRKRLSTHKTKPHNNVMELLRQNFPDRIRAAWWAIPAFDRKFLYGIEGEALSTFEQRFGVLPICNLDVPEFFEGGEYCRDLVRIIPCEVKTPLFLDELAHQVGRVLVRKELEPDEVGITLRFELEPDEVGITLRFAGTSLDISRARFKMAALLTREQVELEEQTKSEQEEGRKWEPDEEHEEEMQLYKLALIHDVNLAAWSIDKMQEVINLCHQLKPKSTRAKKMKPFEAPYREVPSPHTWGEVALVQARIIGGSWQPGKQVWVKVLHGNMLLGEARLNMGWYVGEDKSDLPQRKNERPKCLDYELKDEPIEYVEEEEKENIYGLQISRWKATESNVDEQIDVRIRQAKEALWQAVEDSFQRAIRQMDCLGR